MKKMLTSDKIMIVFGFIWGVLCLYFVTSCVSYLSKNAAHTKDEEWIDHGFF